MSRADIMAGRAYVSLYTKQDAFTRGLQSARADLNKFGSDMMSIGAKVAGIGGLMITPLTASVKVAANFEEAISKFNFVFKGAKDSAKDWADGFAKQVGRSRLQIVEFMADSQALVMPIGFKDDQAVEMSKQLTNLAVDLASFNNMADADVLRDLHAALVGSSETMLKYGVIANEAAVKQELLNMAINPKDATNRDKVQARYNLIMRGTVEAQGDATRTANSLTNMMKRLWGIVSDVAVEVGGALIPALSRIAESVVSVIRPLAEMARLNPELVVSFAAVAGGVIATGIAIMGLGVAAKVTAAGLAAASVVYKIAAIGAAAAWTAVTLAFSVITIKAKISAAIASTAWSVASTVIATSWKALSTILSASISTAVLVASASIIAGAWLAAAAAISVAIFGLGAVLATTATVATAAWTAAGGFVTAAWVATAGAVSAAWAASSATISALAGVAVGAWVSGAGLMGTVMAVLSAAFAATGATGSIGATVAGAAWALAGTVSSVAWSAFTAVLGTVFTASNLLVAAAFAVKTAWAAAWLVISGPILPFIAAAAAMAAVVGAIAASAAYATVRAMDFSEAWGVAKDTLFEIIGIAKQVGGILMTALQQGDYDIAFKAAMAGVKLALATTVDAMAGMWETFWSGAWKAAQTFMRNFVELSMKVVSAVAEALANPTVGAAKLGLTLGQMSKDMKLSFSIDTKGMKENANAELDRLEKELADRQAKRDAENKAKADAEAAAAGENSTAPGAGGEGSAFGDQTAAQMDGAAAAEEAKTAFDRETESIRQQIIALREGEEAAERFRLSKQGLTDAEIEQVMALRKEQEAIEKEQENARRIVERIQDYADAEADNKDNKLTPAQIAAKEKAAIDWNLKQGRIDAKTAAEGMAEADVRQAEREHQDRLKKLRGEGDAAIGANSFGLKSGGASAATFSAQSLLSMGSGAGQGPQLRAMLETKRLIADQTKKQEEQSAAQIAAIKNSKMKHS